MLTQPFGRQQPYLGPVGANWQHPGKVGGVGLAAEAGSRYPARAETTD
jgi:hypothetical protein